MRKASLTSKIHKCTAIRLPLLILLLLTLAASLPSAHFAQLKGDEQIDSLISEGISERKSGENEQSIRTLEEALKLSRNRKYFEGESSALGFLSLGYRLQGDYQKVLECRLASLQLVRAHREIFITEQRNEEPWELGGVSGAYFWLKDLPTAVRYAREAVASAQQGGENEKSVTMARQLQRLGILLVLTGQYKEAEGYLRRAFDGFESVLHLEFTAGMPSVSTYDLEVGVLRWLQEDLVAQHRTEEALEVAERSRSRALAAVVATRLKPGASATVPAPLALQQIKQVAKSHAATLVEYSVVYQYDPDLLLEFSGFEDIPAASVLMWVIKPDGSIAFRQTDLSTEREPLQQVVTQARASVGAFGRGAAKKHAASTHVDTSPRKNIQLQHLHRILIQPIEDLLPTNPDDPIILIPQDVLSFVPFAALQDSSGKYLVEKHTPVNATSVQMLSFSADQLHRTANVGAGVLVVGNPAMPKIVIEAGQPPIQLPALPAAENEARQIAALFAAKPLVGTDATKENVLAHLRSARIVHFATHGLLDNVAGGYFASLALAPSKTDPGYLTMREIDSLNLSAELVVLSACDTAEGRLNADGVLGFSRAFISAGIPSLVVSLWSIPDAPTALLMNEFYTSLKKGKDKAQALRQAMLRTMKDYPGPGNWAAFVLIGESGVSPGLQAVRGDSPIRKESRNATAPAVFPVPPDIRNYLESPDARFGAGAVGISFDTALSIPELIKFYRESFLGIGLREELALANMDAKTFQLVFLGKWKDREIVIQGTDFSDIAKNGGRTVSIRFEEIR